MLIMMFYDGGIWCFIFTIKRNISSSREGNNNNEILLGNSTLAEKNEDLNYNELKIPEKALLGTIKSDFEISFGIFEFSATPATMHAENTFFQKTYI